MQELTVSFGSGKNLAEITKTKKLSWPALIDLLSTPIVGADKASRGWYIPAEFSPIYRDSENFVARYALTLDYDHIETFDVGDIFDSFAPYTYFAYTTFSHTPDKPRLRVVLPLARAVSYDECQAISRRLASIAGIELAARESHSPAQMMFLPVRKEDAEFQSWVNAKQWVDPDEVLATYARWDDRAEWPTRKDGDSVYLIDGQPLTPPTEKPGVIGAFCRAYSIPEAIEAFDLPYKPTANPDRWTYEGGTRPEGAIVYDNGLKLHSHHDSDIGRGQHNAFDLVRLHKYGELDDAVSPDTKVTERPSYKAMCEFARQDERVAPMLALDASKEFEDVPAQTPEEKGALKFAVKDFAKVKDLPAPRWIIKRVLPEAEFVMLYGPAGSGKSFLTLDMAASVAQGKPWRGLNTMQGLVVVVAAEGASGYIQRMKAIAEHQGINEKEMPGVITDAPNLREASDAADIARRVLDWAAGRKVSLVIVDTLSAAAAGSNENSGEDMGAIVAHCKLLHKKTGATVLVVHHSGKDESRGARGWSGLRAAADTEIEVSRNGDIRGMSISKMKDGTDGLQFGFKLKTVTLGIDQDGDPITSCVIEHTDAVAPRKRLPDPTDLETRSVLNMAREYLGDGRAVTEYELSAAIVNKLPDAGNRDKSQNRILRLLQKFVSVGYLYYNDRMLRAVASIPVSDENFLDD